MQQALSLAKKALGHVSPNPAVGAVVLKNAKTVGEGLTQPPGGPHAEVMALQQAGALAHGGVLYVTMEPCCHYGRTSPCFNSILEAGIREVHIAMQDPNPLVNGKGVLQLEKSGIRVFVGEREQDAQRLSEAYTKYITLELPFVIAKFASSLDGKISTVSGETRWITGEESRQQVHLLRETVDAIMVGIGTLVADDPLLTPRTGFDHDSQPLRVIVDSHGQTSSSLRLFTDPGPVLIATASVSQTERLRLEKSGAEVICLPAKDDRVDLPALLRHLGQHQVTSLLVEGGGILLGSFFEQQLVDKVTAFIAPIILGGMTAPTAVAGNGYPSIAHAPRLREVSFNRLGEDIVVEGYPIYS
jgi:diaminohydroxyphosphoribosylaminopyrimidine deaminase/5-amino-6-(5-phosphoribosylamino)uracil reductase